MKVPPAALAAGLLGLLLASSRKSEAVVMPVPGWTPFQPAPAPKAPPPTPPREVVPPPPPAIPVPSRVPPLTVPPNGRHLSPEEKAVLAPYIPQVDLDNAIMWWGAPASSFTSEDPSVFVVALTTSRGIYFRDQNHAIVEPAEFATLAHELVHVGQQRTGEVNQKSKAELELPAYQTGLRVRTDLDALTGVA